MPWVKQSFSKRCGRRLENGKELFASFGPIRFGPRPDGLVQAGRNQSRQDRGRGHRLRHAGGRARGQRRPAGRAAGRLSGEVPAVTLNRMCGSSQQAIHFAAQDDRRRRRPLHDRRGRRAHDPRADVQRRRRTLDKLNPDLLRIQPDPSGRKRRADGREIQAHARRRRRVFDGKPSPRQRCAARDGATAKSCRLPGSTRTATDHAHRDEGIRDSSTRPRFASLPTVFRPDGNGVVTAANSSQISDGAVGRADRRSRSGPQRTACGRGHGFWPAWPSATIRRCNWPASFRPRARRWSGPADDQRYRLDRNQRGLCHGRAGLGQGVEAADGTSQPVGRRHRPWTSAGRDRRRLDGQDARRAGSDRRHAGLQTMCIGHGMATATIIERI